MTVRQDDRFPLLDMQEAYLRGRSIDTFGNDRGTHAYWELLCTHTGCDDLVSKVKRLFGEHETFRMLVDRDEGSPTQHLIGPQDIELTQDDARGLTDGARSDLIAIRRRQLFGREFDPHAYPRFAAGIIWLDDSTALLQVACDGMLVDGHGLSLMGRELDALLATGEGVVDPSFTGYLTARLALEEDVLPSALEDDRAFWRTMLDGYGEVPVFPGGAGTTTTAQGKDGDSHGQGTFQVIHHVPSGTWQAFCGEASSKGITPFAMALTLHGHVISRHSGAERFLINIPSRPLHLLGLPEVMGMTSSFLLFPWSDSASPLLEQAQATTGTLFELQDHAQLSGPALLTTLSQATGRLAQAPITFTYLKEELPSRSCVHTRYMRIHTSQTLLETTLFERDDGSLDIAVSAREGQVPETLARDMSEMLVRGITLLGEGGMDAQLTALPLGPRAQSLIDDLNADTGGIDPAPLSRLLADSLTRHSGRQAICGDFGSISYGELGKRCHALLHAIVDAFPDLERNAVPWDYDRDRICGYVGEHHDSVGILLPKGHLQVIATIACLLGSVPYMPINPHLPTTALEAACGNAGVDKLIVSDETLELASSLGSKRLLNIDRLGLDMLGETEGPTPDEQTLRHLDEHSPHLLCINTSGSTGLPKTISLNDWALSNCLVATQDVYGLDSDTRAIALTNIGHDMALFDTIGPILHGGCVVTLTDRQRREPAEWLRLIREHDVNTWSSVPAFMQMFLELDAGEMDDIAGHLRTCIFGGDFLGIPLCRTIRRRFPRARVFNCGGPSETTLWNISHEVTDQDLEGGAIPYGTPFPGSRYWILDALGRLCPPGVKGIMNVSGITLSNGYLRGDGLVQDGFGRFSGMTVFETGDVGVYDPSDGEIGIHGRDDGQVKVNGKRVELAGIERVLLGLGGIGQAAVVLHESKRLVAFVTATGPIDERSLREEMGETLPSYMVPARIVQVDGMPLTDNTKVDRKSLASRRIDGTVGTADMDGGIHPTGRFATEKDPRRGHIAQTLAALLHRTLEAPVGLDDNFYLVGGDSLAAMRIAAGIKRELGVDLAVYDLLGSPELSTWVDLVLEQQEKASSTQQVDLASLGEQVLATVKRYLVREDIALDDDFLAIGGDATLAAVIADELSRVSGSPVSRYDLLFSPRMDDWPGIVAGVS